MPAVPDGACATELLADDIAASVQQADLGSAHVSGLSPGAATAVWLAAQHPGVPAPPF